jgi:hypothetical protein
MWEENGISFVMFIDCMSCQQNFSFSEDNVVVCAVVYFYNQFWESSQSVICCWEDHNKHDRWISYSTTRSKLFEHDTVLCILAFVFVCECVTYLSTTVLILLPAASSSDYSPSLARKVVCENLIFYFSLKRRRLLSTVWYTGDADASSARHNPSRYC